MASLLFKACVLLSLALISTPTAAWSSADSSHTLPVFFFHGVTASGQIATNLQQNLSTDARPFVPLTFCEKACSSRPLNDQTKLAIDQIRNITTNDRRFDNGYVFIGHSQGGAIARSVIEDMDDHKVHTFISIAGAVNGLFYGPQDTDFAAAKVYLTVFAPALGDKTLFDYSKYNESDLYSGKYQVDSLKVDLAHPELQDKSSGSNMNRSPFRNGWLATNKFLPRINNLLPATDADVAKEQARRKNNFLKLEAAHFFASPYDETISPWQSSILGHYTEVSSVEELEKNFRNLTMLPYTETVEYKQDTYGLKTLDQRGGLFLHVVEKVGHRCWVADAVPHGRTEECKFRPVYEKTLYPLLSPALKPMPPQGCMSSD